MLLSSYIHIIVLPNSSDMDSFLSALTHTELPLRQCLTIEQLLLFIDIFWHLHSLIQFSSPDPGTAEVSPPIELRESSSLFASAYQITNQHPMSLKM